jgi:hypothetical protein
MSLLRSPNGCGIGGSQPNLTNFDFESVSDREKSQITVRNKRKQPDDDNDIKKDISDLKQQMKEMMALLTSTANLHTEGIDKLSTLSQDVTTIKDEVRNISNTIDHIILEQNSLKTKLEDLKITSDHTEKRLKSVESDLNLLKNTPQTSTSKPTASTYEELLTEVQERSARAKNIIIVGIPESQSNLPAARNVHDIKEITTLTKAINASCRDPDKVFRLGPFKTDASRPIKVCYRSDEITKSLLRSKNKPVGNIKIYSDQTVIQRRYLQELKGELQSRIAKGETNLRIKYKKGIPIITDNTDKKEESLKSDSRIFLAHPNALEKNK